MPPDDAVDLSGRTALLIGHGQSSDALKSEGVDWLKREHPGLFVVGCNRGWGPWPLDMVVTIDRAQAWELLRLRRFEHQLVATTQRAVELMLKAGHDLPHGLEQGRNWVQLPNFTAGMSSGTVAFQTVLRFGVRRVVLIGFDGSANPSSRFHGTDGYRDKAPPKTYEGWEKQMRKIANYYRETMGARFETYLALPYDSEHPLDALPAERIRIHKNPAEDIHQCLNSFATLGP